MHTKQLAAEMLDRWANMSARGEKINDEANLNWLSIEFDVMFNRGRQHENKTFCADEDSDPVIKT